MSRAQYMNILYGPDRKDDSNRCRAGGFAYDHPSPGLVTHPDMVAAFKFTSEYGPGLGEEWSVSQSRQEIARLKRRLGRNNMPFDLLDHGGDVWELAPKKA